MRPIALCSSILAASLVAGCTTDTDQNVDTTESAVIGDVVRMTRRPDGNFDVVCRGVDGAPNRTEIATQEDVLQNRVCTSKGQTEWKALDGRSIWDDAWRAVPAADTRELLPLFSPGTSKYDFDSSVFASRYRSCNYLTGCEPWNLVDGIHVRGYSGQVLHAQRSIPMSLRTRRSTTELECAEVELTASAKYPNISSATSRCSQGAIGVNTTVPGNTSFDGVGLHVPLTVTSSFVFGRSDIVHFEVGSDSHRGESYDGRYIEVEYAFYAKLISGAPTPALDR